MQLNQKQVQHLYLRAGFGELPDIISGKTGLSSEQIFNEIYSASVPNTGLTYFPDPLKGKNKSVSNFQILAMILKSREEMQNLNFEWLYRMSLTPAFFREKMTLFWHNHFATSVPFSYLMQLQNNTLRSHALGKFSALLKAVSKDPAMILYLNNQENHKDHPNENFAREVMELFTLGIGHYSEKDIKEAARAFTGWTVNRKGKFEFRETDHDQGEKEFLGKKGNFGGEDILDILLEQEQTARFIVKKILTFFVHDEPDDNLVNTMAAVYFKNGMDTGELMKIIFTSEWFYDEKYIGCKIASPVELLARYIRLFHLEFQQGETLLDLQQTLGQTLFFPPNVAGWKGGNAWIDSSSLLLRLTLPKRLLLENFISVKGKPAYEETDQKKIQKTSEGSVKADWAVMEDFFMNHANNPRDFLLQIDRGNNAGATMVNDIRNNIAEIMSYPEFQLI